MRRLHAKTARMPMQDIKSSISKMASVLKVHGEAMRLRATAGVFGTEKKALSTWEWQFVALSSAKIINYLKPLRLSFALLSQSSSLLLKKFCLLTACTLFAAVGSKADFSILSPTKHLAFQEGKPPIQWVQPTISGKPSSALFGCTRNRGQRFHEGLDIRPLQRDRMGEATDSVFASLAGKVVFINTHFDKSNYGRYVVLEHEQTEPVLYTLYAHLAEIDKDLSLGGMIKQGERLGKMGRSANHRIPQKRAHLHWEIGLRLSDAFEVWYQQQHFDEPNRFGNFHGWNLQGFDPLDFLTQWRSGKIKSITSYLKSLPIAYRVQVRNKRAPFFVQRHPSLLLSDLPSETELKGWEIGFTIHGLPTEWKPILEIEDFSSKAMISLTDYQPQMFAAHPCLKPFTSKRSQVQWSESLLSRLGILFQHKVTTNLPARSP